MTTTHFGFQSVEEADKAKHVRGVFDSVAPKYDLMNDLMSMGLHRAWKAYTVLVADLKEGYQVLDIAGGTGDLALAFAKKVGPSGRVVHTDINEAMLSTGRNRLIDAGVVLPTVVCDAEKLPFADAQFDVVSVAFGLRNMTHKELALAEMNRVLKPGGTFIGSVPNLWMNEHGHNPVPYHLHIYDHAQLHEQVARYFTWTALYRQNAGGGWKRPQPRILQAIPNCVPSAEDCRDAEWWIAVATKPGA